MTNIAFLGTGIMGSGMAHNLLKTGYSLTLHNRTRSKAKPLLDAGANWAASPADAVAGADIILTITGDDESSRQTWLGKHGVLSGNLKPGAIAIESTTLSLAWVLELNQILTAAGLRYIDCPVTGGRNGAEQGKLTLLVGTDGETLADADAVLSAYSQEIIHFGAVGTATTYKLMVNLMVAAQATALAEGLALAMRAGLDMNLVIQGVSSGAVASRVVKAYAREMALGEHDRVNFSTRWLHKDAVYALQMASQIGQAMPMSAVAAQVFQMALDAGAADKNASAVIKALTQV